MTNLNMFCLHSRQRASGFTLIELLIVMIIISVVGTVAVLSLSYNQTTRYANFAKEIVNTLTLATEEAMLKPSILGLKLTATHYQFYQYDDLQKPPVWQAITTGALGQHTIPDTIQVTVRIRDKTQSLTVDTSPQLIISTSGDMIPFTISIGKPNSPPSYEVVGHADGSLTSGPITPHSS